MAARDQSPLPRVRLDVWLFRARVVKSRSLAAKLVSCGHVRVNGGREKAPGRGLIVGDVLTIALDRTVRTLEVAAFGARRGPFDEARALFRDLDAPAEHDRASQHDGESSKR